MVIKERNSILILSAVTIVAELVAYPYDNTFLTAGSAAFWIGRVFGVIIGWTTMLFILKGIVALFSKIADYARNNFSFDKAKTLSIAAVAVVAAFGGKALSAGGGYALGYGVTRAVISAEKNNYSTDSEVIQAVNQMAIEAKKNMPKKLDEYTTLVDAVADGKTITYKNNLLVMKEEVPDNFGSDIKQEICTNLAKEKDIADFMKVVLPKGVKVVYAYYDLKGDLVSDIVVKNGTCIGL